MCPWEPKRATGGDLPKQGRRDGNSVPTAQALSCGQQPEGRVCWPPRGGPPTWLYTMTCGSSVPGLPVLCPGVWCPGGGGLLEIPQPHPGECPALPPSHSRVVPEPIKSPLHGRETTLGGHPLREGGWASLGLGQELPGKREQVQASEPLPPPTKSPSPALCWVQEFKRGRRAGGGGSRLTCGVDYRGHCSRNWPRRGCAPNQVLPLSGSLPQEDSHPSVLE